MLDDLYFLHGRHSPRCTETVDRPFQHVAIQFAATGGVHFRKDEATYEFQGPTLWMSYPGPHFFFCPVNSKLGWDHRYLAFHGPLASQWLACGLLIHEPIEVAKADVPQLTDRFDRMIEAAFSPAPRRRFEALHLLLGLLLEYADDTGATEPDNENDWLDEVLVSLGDVETPDPDYAALARRYHMAETTLRSHFRQAVGVPIHRYRVMCKVAAARRLLGETNQPIKQIADALGYRDVFYFTRQFTKETGASPSAYRRSRQ